MNPKKQHKNIATLNIHTNPLKNISLKQKAVA